MRDDRVRRTRAAEVLGQLGQKMARRVVPVLIRDLDTGHPTPVWSVRTLGEFGLEADQALPALRWPGRRHLPRPGTCGSRRKGR